MARTLLVLFIAAFLPLGGCCFYCEHGVPFVVCPDEAIVGETVEVIVTGDLGSDLTIEWSVDGEAELVAETSETAVITPTGPGTIIVTITATDEASGASASDTCTFEAVEESETG